jgi:hypothetical protein
MNKFNENPDQLVTEFNRCFQPNDLITINDGIRQREVAVQSAAFVMAGCAVFYTNMGMEFVQHVISRCPQSEPCLDCG